MIEENDANHDAEQSNRSQSAVAPGHLRWVLIGGGIAFLGLLLAAIYWPNLTERTKFFTGNLLNLVIGLAVMAQVLIYRKQWDSMRDQVRIMGVAFNARLRITNVRVEDFEAGKEPVFIVSIINEGATDAKDVALNMRVELAEEERHAVKWSNPQVVTIHAGQEQHYFVPARSLLTQERIDDFNNSAVPLRVTGFFQLRDSKQKEFCYRYYPWGKTKRPAGVSQFIPCDFNPALTHVVSLKGVEAKATISTVGVVIKKTPLEEARKDEQQNPK